MRVRSGIARKVCRNITSMSIGKSCVICFMQSSKIRFPTAGAAHAPRRAAPFSRTPIADRRPSVRLCAAQADCRTVHRPLFRSTNTVRRVGCRLCGLPADGRVPVGQLRTSSAAQSPRDDPAGRPAATALHFSPCGDRGNPACSFCAAEDRRSISRLGAAATTIVDDHDFPFPLGGGMPSAVSSRAMM